MLSPTARVNLCVERWAAALGTASRKGTEVPYVGATAALTELARDGYRPASSSGRRTAVRSSRATPRAPTTSRLARGPEGRRRRKRSGAFVVVGRDTAVHCRRGGSRRHRPPRQTARRCFCVRVSASLRPSSNPRPVRPHAKLRRREGRGGGSGRRWCRAAATPSVRDPWGPVASGPRWPPGRT